MGRANSTFSFNAENAGFELIESDDLKSTRPDAAALPADPAIKT
jgi:hypothetical protein